MTLRTPRRRISPRTRLRYRAIREFFRRALGSTSQQNIKINSSIAVNVTELKRKIVGLEQQLGEVSKHCRDIVSLDRSRRESETGFQLEPKQDISLDTISKQNEPSCDHNLEPVKTHTIYKSSGCQRNISQNSDFTPTHKHDDTKDIESVIMSDGYVAKVTNKKNRLHKIANTSSKLHKHKTRSVYDNTAIVYSTSSFHSLADARMVNPSTIYLKHPNESRKQYKHENKDDIMPHNHKTHKYYGNVKNYLGDHVKGYHEDKVHERTRKPKRIVRELDPEFIADIVRRQYKPVKLFSRKDSELSQFSAPVCRDQELSVPASLKADSELCSCLHGGYSCHKRLRPRRQDLNAMKSVCDARLYSSKKYLRPKHRKVHDAHSNSDMYDLIPVKERSSPKSRKKFIEDNQIPYEYYREVPPSPRTHRPRLNLKAQYYTELEDYMVHTKHQLKRPSPKMPKRYQVCSEQFESDNPSEIMSDIAEKRAAQAQKHLKVPVHMQTQNRTYPDATISGQYPQQANEQTSITVDSSLNKTQGTDITADKTDKALTEIKDILQSFLHEIKKEAVTSQCDNSDITSKMPDDNNMNNILQDMNPSNHAPSNMLPNSASFNNYNNSGLGMTPLIAPFTNPYCYQVLPMCSLNCPMPVPNGYVVPSQSYTCTNCVKTQKDDSSAHCCNKSTDQPCKQGTDELIKEIYKFVAHGPPRNNTNDTNNEKQAEYEKTEAVVVTSRSAGGSNKFLKQDANVGTQPLKCQSKSCEAIGPKLTSDVYISESNESYTDSLLDKLSIEVPPQSYSETEVGSTPDTSKVKVNRFSRVLRSFGLFKKKKKDVIEEVSESESTTRVDPRENQLPFRQYVTNRVSYEHDYFQPPLAPLHPAPRDYVRPQEYPRHPFEYNAPWHEYQRRPHEYLPDYHPPYNPSMRAETSSHFHDLYAHRYSPQMVNEHHNDYSHSSKQRPTAPPFNSAYDSSYNDMQAGLCLKEIEVKSTGTQSERKMSILKKMKKKIKPSAKIPEDDNRRNQKIAFSSQVKQVPIQTKEKPNKSLFNWRNLQAKAMNGIQNDVSFSLKTQQELTESDQKLRKVLLRKLFNKRNPFSPRNTIVKTLLMKDKAMEDIPTLKSLRTKMFM